MLEANVAFIGCGNMGEAILRRLLEASTIEKTRTAVVDRTSERRAYVAGTYGVKTGEAADVARTADIVVLGIKPQQLVDLPTIPLKNGAIVVSMLAGTTIQKIQSHFPETAIARIMPNLAFGVGHAVTGLVFDHAREWMASQKSTVQQLLSPGGLVIEVENESRMNEITATSGSGPAYFYWFSEQMVAAAKNLGFTDTQANQIVREVFIGVASSLEANPDISFADFRQRVTSKGGTTEAALNVFNNSDISQVVSKALEAARDRSQELAN